MSTAGIEVATATTNTHLSVVGDKVEAKINRVSRTSETNSVICVKNSEESSFCTLSLENKLTLADSTSDFNLLHQKNIVPLGNIQKNDEEIHESSKTAVAPTRYLSEFPNNHVKQEAEVLDHTLNVTQQSPGLTLLQQTAASSPPPHSYRHSRAYRHFKNPPQPHMCIRTTTESGEELFINVLSWTRIVIPQEPSDPIPLYGGMRVPPGSPRSPPIVFAVMANPEVLKDSGRHSKDPEERRAMIELMCDFVEAMNPGVKLVRHAVILKDRDISGELKDVWNAVQAQRDREREEQLLLQRQQQQQHFLNLSNANSPLLTSTTCAANSTASTTQQMFSKSMQHNGTEGDSILMTEDGVTSPRSRKLIHKVQIDNDATSNNDMEIDTAKLHNAIQVPLGLLAEHFDNKMSLDSGGEHGEGNEYKQKQNNQNSLINDALSNENNSKSSLMQESGNKIEKNNQINAINCNKDLKQQQQQSTLTNGSARRCNDANVSDVSKTVNVAAEPKTPLDSPIPAQNSTTSIAAASIPAPHQQVPTKKEKLGGFLPNGCIFPRFTKNNKHKDKEKDKDKEPKTKDKERNALLSALKKSKEKKSNSAAATAAASNQDEKNTSLNSNTTAANSNHTNNKQQQNCLQKLESGMQKIDLNNHHSPHIADKSFGNVSTNNTSNTNQNNSTTTTSSGVGVH